MSIFDIFRSAPTQQQQAPNQQQQQQTQVQNNQHVNNNPTIPNDNNQQQRIDPNTKKVEESPMDKFKDAFKIDPNQAGKDEPLFNLDPAKFQENVSKLDFTKSLKPEDLQAISKGGDEAVQAFARVLNKVGQESFAAAAQFSAKLTESGVHHSRESLMKDLPSHIRRQSAANELFQNNPALRNPAAQPLIEAMQANFEKKFPNASTSEINQMVGEYFSGLSGLFTKPDDPNAKKEPEETDFGKWVGM